MIAFIAIVFLSWLVNDHKCERNIDTFLPPDKNEEYIRYTKKRDEEYENSRHLDEFIIEKPQLRGHQMREKQMKYKNSSTASILHPKKPWMSFRSVDGLKNVEVAVFLISSSFQEGLFLRSR